MVIAKPGLDGHDRGAKIIARALRDAGMEVIYTGLHQTPEQIVETAIQEDADAVGVSILSGAHMTLVPRIVDGLRANGAEDVLVVVGGTIPQDDADELKSKGVAEVFGPGATTGEIVDFLRGAVPSSVARPTKVASRRQDSHAAVTAARNGRTSGFDAHVFTPRCSEHDSQVTCGWTGGAAVVGGLYWWRIKRTPGIGRSDTAADDHAS